MWVPLAQQGLKTCVCTCIYTGISVSRLYHTSGTDRLFPRQTPVLDVHHFKFKAAHMSSNRSCTCIPTTPAPAWTRTPSTQGHGPLTTRTRYGTGAARGQSRVHHAEVLPAGGCVSILAGGAPCKRCTLSTACIPTSLNPNVPLKPADAPSLLDSYLLKRRSSHVVCVRRLL